ncbi:MAG: immunoglobulin domain-containing protein, partial [Limisphaerales bacterium]
MKSILLLTAALLPLGSIARADFNPIALTADSFTQDVIVEKGATPPAQTLVTANMDAGTNLTGTVGGTGGNHGAFYEIGFGTTAGSGLPLHGSVFNAVSNATHTFQMPSDYTMPNAVFVGGAGSISPQVQSGVLTLTTPSAFTHLSLLAAAGGGATYIQYTINYGDGNSEQQTIVVTDWLTTNNATTGNTAWIANGWFRGSDGSYQNVNTKPQTGRLFYYDLPLGFASSPVSSVQIDFVSGSRAAVFGVSGSTDNGATFQPINVTGYNYDMIIEAPLAKTVTATMDNGILIPTNSTMAINRGDNASWFEQGFNLINASTAPIPRDQTGLPHPGTTFNAWSNAAHAFQMPSSYTAPNAVLLNSQSQSGTLTLSSPTTLSAISVLSTAGNGPLTVALTINHQDGSSEITNYSCVDWFANPATNPNVAYIAGGRVPTGRLNTINNGGTNAGTIIWFNDVSLSNPSSPVTSVQFGYTTGTGRVAIFGISGSTDGVNFSALTVTGFNQDMVVEANAITNMDLRAFSSATMDGGTNNNANIWYEQGWNPLAPDSGLPPAGSMISSTNLPDHHYQLASDYRAKNAVYCDSNNPTATITFATPSTFSAVSFLSANGSGGIQIQVILNNAGAPSETNVFNSKDWFNGAPAAFTANGRCSSDNRSANNWVPSTTSNPRLYEAQFALADTVHNVTGATMIWTTNNGTGGISGANSRFVVLAVSGTTGATPPVISSVVPQSFTGYEGTNFTLAASAGGNPAPSYQWQAGVSGSGVFTNLTDGPVISGSTTATLTFTGASLNNNEDYQLVAVNAVGSATSVTVPVKILSALPDVIAAGDPITQFGGTSPNGQDVTRAIDRVVGTNKYLNFGANGGLPFAGPVGLIVTPSMGSTIVSVMRVYPGNDHEERDPADYILEGSNDGGANWTQLSSGALALPSTRTATAALNPLTQLSQEIHFANSTAYTSYRWTVNNVKTNSAANSMSLGEIELLGTLNPTPPYFNVQPVAAV